MLLVAVIERLDGIVERGCGERLGGNDFESLAGVVNLTPVADVGLVPCLL